MQSCTKCDSSFEESLDECPRCAENDSNSRPRFVAVAAMTAQFITQAGNSSVAKKLGDIWPASDEVCFQLILEVERKFKKKNKFHSFFTKNNDPDSAASLLDSYVKSEVDFTHLVSKFMDALVNAATETGAHRVSGGNIVFMHYKNHNEEDDIGRLLAIWVTKKEGFDFDETSLLPRGSSHLNLDAMRQAALFDLTLFNAVYPDVPEEETYLKFIKGTSSGAFFKVAFGCDENNAGNVDSVKNFRTAIVDFQELHKLQNDFYHEASAKAEVLFAKSQRNGKPVSLSALCNAVDGLLPDDSPIKGTFRGFVNNNEYEINQHIEPTLNSVKAGQTIDVFSNDRSFSAKILRKQVGPSGSGNVVEYDDGRLTFLILDEAQKKELSRLADANDG